MIIIAVLVLTAAGVYFMNVEERRRLLRWIFASVRRGAEWAMRLREQHRTRAEADEAPQPWPVVTFVLAGAILLAYVWTALAPGDLGDAEALVGFGANVGPRTVNGEWWRLLTSGFLHASLLALIVNLAALLQAGALLERVVGRPALVAVYLSAGVFAGLVSVSAQPVDVLVGASGYIFGLYGLLLTAWMWGLIQHAPGVRLPIVVKLAPAAGVFVLYHALAGQLPGTAHTAGLVTGFLGGLVLAHGVHVRKPSARRIAAAIGVTAMVALLSAVPLRGLTDVRPILAQIVSVEKATAAAYDAHVAKFREGRASAEALCTLIEQQILPELREADAALRALHGVPPAHAPLTAAAQGFVSLRVESWQLRMRGLRKGSMPMLREADRIERESLGLFEKLAASQPAAASHESTPPA